MRGVSLVLLKEVERVARQKGGHWTVARIANVLVGGHEILRDGHRWGAIDPADTLTFADKTSLIDVLKKHHKTPSDRHPELGVCYDEVVGEKATVFVSFTYNSDFFELVSSIESYVEANPGLGDSYFWFDMLVNCQWSAMDHDFDWWSSTFKQAVGEIGHTLLVCLPWSDPEPLKRAWCLWEIYCSVSSDSKFDIALGSAQHEAFVAAIVSKPEEYYNMLSRVSMQKSTCYLAEDRANIFKAVEGSVGFSALNAMVAVKLRQWVLSAIDSSIKNTDEHVHGEEGAGGGEDTMREALWSKHLAKGKMLEDMGDYAAAMDVFQKCMLDFGGGENRSAGCVSGMALNRIGRLLDLQGEHSSALRHFESALQTLLPIVGPLHSELADTYGGIASALDGEGKYAESLVYYRKSLEIELKLSEAVASHLPSVAVTYNNMASVFDSLGDYSAALAHYKMSLEIKLKALGDAHPSVATTYHNMARLFDTQGDCAAALEYFHKSLAIDLTALGDMHPEVATTYHNMASVFDGQGDHLQAMAYYQKSLDIRLSALEEAHPSVAATYHGMASVLDGQGKYEDAMRYYEKSLEIRLSALGELHADVADSYHGIASVHSSQSSYEEARLFYGKSLDIYVKTLGEAHPSVATVYHSMASMFDRQGDYASALTYYNKCLDIYVSTLGASHLYVATTASNIGVAHFNRGEYDVAMGHFQRSLDVCLQARGEAHADTKDTLAWIRMCLQRTAGWRLDGEEAGEREREQEGEQEDEGGREAARRD